MTEDHNDEFQQPSDAPAGEQVEESDEKFDAQKLSDAAVKMATETGYAVAGFADLIGEKAKAFYEEQKRQYANAHPDDKDDPGAQQFLDQLSRRLQKLVDDLTKGAREMADRGRESLHRDRFEVTPEDKAKADTVDAPQDFEVPAEEQTSTEFTVADDERHDL